MSHNPKNKTEIIPSPAYLLHANNNDATLAEMVQREVARILPDKIAQGVAETLAARDNFSAFEPFFRSRQVAFEIRRLQSVPEQKKWAVHYERFGCLHCGVLATEKPHATNGLCRNCLTRVFTQLKSIIHELMGESGPREPFQYDYAAMGRKGGAARTEHLSPEERSESARNAVNARWAKARMEESEGHGEADSVAKVEEEH